MCRDSKEVEINLTVNENLGGVLLLGSNVCDKEMFFEVKRNIEQALGKERILGVGLSYSVYSPFNIEPIYFQITDTVRAKSTNEVKHLLKNVDSLVIKD